MEIALNAGADDVRSDEDSFEVITAPDEFESVRKTLGEASVSYTEAEITMLPKTTSNLEGKEAEQMFKLMDALEDCDDVQKVYTNADIPEDVVANME